MRWVFRGRIIDGPSSSEQGDPRSLQSSRLFYNVELRSRLVQYPASCQSNGENIPRTSAREAFRRIFLMQIESHDPTSPSAGDDRIWRPICSDCSVDQTWTYLRILLRISHIVPMSRTMDQDQQMFFYAAHLHRLPNLYDFSNSAVKYPMI